MVMWKAVSSKRESDPEFVVWRIKAENDDGREQSVLVKIDVATVANTPWIARKGVARPATCASRNGKPGNIPHRVDATQGRVAAVDRLPIRDWRVHH